MRDEQYVSFRIDEHLFGINILTVREIIRNVEITPVERSPESVRGLLNLRGQIITVLDLGPSLGLPLRTLGAGTRCVIIKTADEVAGLIEEGALSEEMFGEAVGLVVDGISDVVEIDEDELESPPANANGLNCEHLKGVVKLESKLLLVLALRKLVEEGMHGQVAGAVAD